MSKKLKSPITQRAQAAADELMRGVDMDNHPEEAILSLSLTISAMAESLTPDHRAAAAMVNELIVPQVERLIAEHEKMEGLGWCSYPDKHGNRR